MVTHDAHDGIELRESHSLKTQWPNLSRWRLLQAHRVLVLAQSLLFQGMWLRAGDLPDHARGGFPEAAREAQRPTLAQRGPGNTGEGRPLLWEGSV